MVIYPAEEAAKVRHFHACLNCGFVRMDDAPDQRAMDRRYVDDESHGREAWKDHEKNLQVFGSITERMERFVKPGRLLDVGCSIGTSLIAARDRGWDPVGIELSKPAAEYGAKEWGLDIRAAPFQNADLEPGSFRAVLFHHTLEHLSEPDDVIRLTYDLLEPGGIMYQALPNYGCMKRRLLGRHWSYGIHLDHVNYFTPRTLSRLSRRIGFQVVDLRTQSYKSDPRLLYDVMGRLHLLSFFMRSQGRRGEEFDPEVYIDFMNRKKWAQWFCARMWPARLVQGLGLGEELHLIARKPNP